VSSLAPLPIDAQRLVLVDGVGLGLRLEHKPPVAAVDAKP
jgi:hypothetical protein